MWGAEWLLPGLWLAFGLGWLVAAASARAAERTESRRSRWLHLGLVGAGFVLLFASPLRVGPLGWRGLGSAPLSAGAGVVLVVAGLALASWARIRLGRRWSGAVAITEGQRLVEAGPYRLVRHPMYSGIGLAGIGSALWVGDLAAGLGAGLIVLAYGRKARVEEAWLGQAFGPAYASYQRRVGAFLPFRRLRTSLEDSRATSRRLLSPAAFAATLERLEGEGRLPSEETRRLAERLPDLTSRSRYVLGHLGAHLTIGVIFAFDVVPLPLGTIARVFWVAGSRVTETVRGASERARIHSATVLLVAAVPWVGYAAYLIPLRRESPEIAWLGAQQISYSLYDVCFDEYVASKPRAVRRIAAWVVPPLPQHAAPPLAQHAAPPLAR
jgi:protein-S-isoprenylcysteine O-methyltransferase Ste14